MCPGCLNFRCCSVCQCALSASVPCLPVCPVRQCALSTSVPCMPECRVGPSECPGCRCIRFEWKWLFYLSKKRKQCENSGKFVKFSFTEMFVKIFMKTWVCKLYLFQTPLLSHVNPIFFPLFRHAVMSLPSCPFCPVRSDLSRPTCLVVLSQSSI
jgi:hypothetical protein